MSPPHLMFLGSTRVFVPNGVSIRAANSQKWKFPTKYCPAHKGYFVGETASPSKNVPRFHTSLLTKQGIDTNSHFCRIKNFLQNFAPSTKDAAAGGTPSPCNKKMFLGSTRVFEPNGVLIWAAIFAELKISPEFLHRPQRLLPVGGHPT